MSYMVTEAVVSRHFAPQRLTTGRRQWEASGADY